MCEIAEGGLIRLHVQHNELFILLIVYCVYNTLTTLPPHTQFVKFAEREEGNTPYHRQYHFLIHRFASLSLTKNVDDADNITSMCTFTVLK